MAFRLIPREERFFDDFVALAEQIRVGAALLEEMLAPERPIWDKADEIKEVEHKCDFITHAARAQARARGRSRESPRRRPSRSPDRRSSSAASRISARSCVQS